MIRKEVKISEIKINPENPRTIKDENFAKLVKSIQDFPEMLEIRPIVVNADMMVLGGNMRLKACKEAGLKEVVIIVADNLSEDQQKEFLIKDNVSGGDWDFDLLADWDSDQLEEWGLEVPEFGAEELEAVEDDFDGTVPEDPITVLGDLYEIGEHRLLCGDSTDSDQVAKLMNGEKADMVMTDPPYNVDYSSKNKSLNEAGKGNRNQTPISNDKISKNDFDNFLLLFFTNIKENMKNGSSIYCFSPPGITETQFRNQFINSGLLFKQCLIWVKNHFVIGHSDYHYKHEPCLYGWKEGEAHYFTNDRTKTTVIEDKLDIKKLKKEEMEKLLIELLIDKSKTSVINHDKPFKSAEHPTMKPILLLAPFIENSSKKNWIVADPFLGSGSTMVASHQLGRRCYGMELDPKYCDVIVKRMIKLDSTLSVKCNGVLTNDFI